MQFEYQNYTAPSIKALITQYHAERGEAVDLSKVKCNGVKWDSSKSDFIKALDRDIKQYKQQLELIIDGLEIDKESKKISDDLYLLKLEEDFKGKERLENIVERASGTKVNLNLKSINRSEILAREQALNVRKSEFSKKRRDLQAQSFKA